MNRPFSASLILAAAVACSAQSAAADQVTETIQSALDAYNAGDVQYAMDSSSCRP